MKSFVGEIASDGLLRAPHVVQETELEHNVIDAVVLALLSIHGTKKEENLHSRP